VICEELNWRQVNGRLKEVACREAFRKMAYGGNLCHFLGKTFQLLFLSFLEQETLVGVFGAKQVSLLHFLGKTSRLL